MFELYNGQDIYCVVSVNMFLPLCAVSAFLAGIVSVVFEILQKILKFWKV
ncbi:MAG: hypothetical protein M0R46_01475 [Candidatus Muirbacterium halophilum]|nr:hypothetical protein [Candidatus Muirbacterium halophilum]MCK9474565.1 hypothetical protein [Candidatus Muirbacterium halophilum]